MKVDKGQRYEENQLWHESSLWHRLSRIESNCAFNLSSVTSISPKNYFSCLSRTILDVQKWFHYANCSRICIFEIISRSAGRSHLTCRIYPKRNRKCGSSNEKRAKSLPKNIWTLQKCIKLTRKLLLMFRSSFLFSSHLFFRARDSDTFAATSSSRHTPRVDIKRDMEADLCLSSRNSKLPIS